LQQQIFDLAELMDDQIPAIEAMTAKKDTTKYGNLMNANIMPVQLAQPHIPC
jgi:hypothetical protein